MRTQLSILIPTFNDQCYDIVRELHRQATAINELHFEILVGDDGSTDQHVVSKNKEIENLSYTHYLCQEKNIGRAAIRNLLARKATFPWLLFVDSGMGIIRSNYLKTYLATTHTPSYGGYVVDSSRTPDPQHNLRYLYEQQAERNHKPEKRQKQPNQHFHTANFLVSREMFLQHPLDQRFRRYGYEDILWGKQLQDAGITIHHIDNPIAFNHFENNRQFVEKTEESLHTLHQFKDELQGYSPLLNLANRITSLHLKPILRPIFKATHKKWRARLCSNNPNLHLFYIYKVFYYLTIDK